MQLTPASRSHMAPIKPGTAWGWFWLLPAWEGAPVPDTLKGPWRRLLTVSHPEETLHQALIKCASRGGIQGVTLLLNKVGIHFPKGWNGQPWTLWSLTWSDHTGQKFSVSPLPAWWPNRIPSTSIERMNNLQELIIRDQGLIIPICKGEESKEDQDHLFCICVTISSRLLLSLLKLCFYLCRKMA